MPFKVYMFHKAKLIFNFAKKVIKIFKFFLNISLLQILILFKKEDKKLFENKQIFYNVNKEMLFLLNYVVSKEILKLKIKKILIT